DEEQDVEAGREVESEADESEVHRNQRGERELLDGLLRLLQLGVLGLGKDAGHEGSEQWRHTEHEGDTADQEHHDEEESRRAAPVDEVEAGVGGALEGGWACTERDSEERQRDRNVVQRAHGRVTLQRQQSRESNDRSEERRVGKEGRTAG